MTLASHYWRTRNLEKAISLAKRWSVQDPANPQPFVLSASSLTRLNFADQSIQESDKALELNPGYLPAIAAKAQLRSRQRRPTEAEILWAKVLDVEPSDGLDEAIRIAGMAALKRKDEAVAAADRLFGSEPNADYAIGTRCLAYFSAQMREATIEACKAFVTAVPESVIAWSALAMAYNVAGRQSDAVESAKRAIAINAEVPEGWLILGLAAEANGESTRASEAEKRLEEVDSEMLERYRIARPYQACMREMRNKLYEKAIDRCREAIRANDSNATLYAALGAALLREKRVDEGIAAHENAVRLDPKLTRSWSDLVYAYANKRDQAKARIAYERLRVLDPRMAEQVPPQIKRLVD